MMLKNGEMRNFLKNVTQWRIVYELALQINHYGPRVAPRDNLSNPMRTSSGLY